MVEILWRRRPWIIEYLLAVVRGRPRLIAWLYFTVKDYTMPLVLARCALFEADCAVEGVDSKTRHFVLDCSARFYIDMAERSYLIYSRVSYSKARAKRSVRLKAI